MADDRQIFSDDAVVVGQGGPRIVGDYAYVVHGPNQREIQGDYIYAVSPEVPPPPPAPTITLVATPIGVGVSLALFSDNVTDLELWQDGVMIDSWTGEDVYTTPYVLTLPAGTYCFEFKGDASDLSGPVTTGQVCLHTQVLTLGTVTPTSVNMSLTSSAATQTQYQIALDTDPTFAVPIDDVTLTSVPLFLNSFSGLIGNTDYLLRARSFTVADGWTAWTPVVAFTTPVLIPPNDWLSSWLAPTYGEPVIDDYPAKLKLEIPATLDSVEIQPDGGAWVALTHTLSEYQPDDATFEYKQILFDTTAFADGFYRLRATITRGADTVTITTHGFFIANSAVGVLHWKATTPGAMVKYSHPTQPLVVRALPYGGTDEDCHVTSDPSDFPAVSPATEGYVYGIGHEGSSVTAIDDPAPSFGPALPLWLTSSKGVDITAAFVVQVRSLSGFWWSLMAPAALNMVGIKFGPARVDVTTGDVGAVHDGILGAASDGFSWGRVGRGLGGATARALIKDGISLHGSWFHGYRAAGSWGQNIGWGLSENTGPGTWLNCSFATAPKLRKIRMRLKVWRPDPVGSPHEISVYAAFAEDGALPSGSVAKLDTDVDDINPVLHEHTGTYDMQPFSTFNCNPVEFYTHGYSSNVGRYLTEYTVFPLEVAPECAVAVPPCNCFTFADPLPTGALQGEAALPTPVLFPFSPNWDNGIQETFKFLTDVIVSEDDTEHRVSLRSKPNRSIGFVPYMMDEFETEYFNSLLWGTKNERWYVPLWQHAYPLNSSAGIGATTLDADIDVTVFGGPAVLWRGPREWEIIDVTDPAGITVSALQAAWGAGTQLIPLAVGRFTEMVAERPSSITAVAPVTFQIEV